MPSRLGKLLLAATERPTIRRLFVGTKPGRAVAQRFVAGEELDAAIAVTQDLNTSGRAVSLDHLGEHVTSITEARAARDDYLKCLDQIGAHRLDANISVKLTQLGLGLDDAVAESSLADLAVHAASVGSTVTVDMEESAHTVATLDVYESVQRRHGNLGIAVQAYLRRTRDDLDRLLPLGGHIRLCKGAYLESEEVAFQSQHEVDQHFDLLLGVVMDAPGVRPAIASHDDGRVAETKRLAAQRSEPWEFQMLYGVRGPLQRELVAAGYPMRVYVPYGVAWYPYLTRRLAERPANLRFFLRALVGRS